MLGDVEHETAFFKWQLYSFLEKANFKQIKILPFDFLHPSTPKALVSFVNKSGLFLEKIPLIKEIAGSLFITATK